MAERGDCSNYFYGQLPAFFKVWGTAYNLKCFLPHVQFSLNQMSGKEHLLACIVLIPHQVALLPN